MMFMQSKFFDNLINFLGWAMLFILVFVFALIGSAVIAGIIDGLKSPIN